MVRGVRGAISVEENTPASILDAAIRLMREMIRANQVDPDFVASVIFTCTADLDATFPAEAARKMGWDRVPLLCSREIAVPGSMPRVLRVLMLINTDRRQEAIQHVYLGNAERLRPDLKSAQ
ncbi:MAG: chorismate mutase [Armatimonadetes bacterium]|nr:chorismate mutase [Armatimonadota bacterium]